MVAEPSRLTALVLFHCHHLIRPLTFHIRTFTMLVGQLQCVWHTSIGAKIIFVTRVFDWPAKTASVTRNPLLYLHYSDTSQIANAVGRQ